jgi:hypothetical protein
MGRAGRVSTGRAGRVSTGRAGRVSTGRARGRGLSSGFVIRGGNR